MRQELIGLWAGGKGNSLAAISLGWALLLGTRMIYPPLLPHLNDDFGLTLTTAGFLVTIIWLAYGIGQMPGGILADRHGERRILMASVSVVIAGLGVVLIAPSVLVLFGATALIGIGISQYPIARITALSRLYPDRLGGAMGVTMAFGDLGQTVLPPIASVLTVAVGWRLGFGYLIPFLCLTLVIIWWTLPETESEDDSSEEPDTSIWEAVVDLRSPTIVIISSVLFLYLFVYQTFSTFYPTYLVSEKGLSQTVTGSLFGLFFAAGVVVKPLAGAIYDRIGLRASLPLVLGGAIVGFALLPFVDSVMALIGVTVLTSTLLGTGTITQSYLAEIIPDNVQGSGLGFVRSSASILGAGGPVVFGAVAERGYFDEGYMVLAGIIAVVTVLTMVLLDE